MPFLPPKQQRQSTEGINSQQIKVMGLEYYNSQMCNKLRASSHDALTVINVINKLNHG